jgi:hypothetical protein
MPLIHLVSTQSNRHPSRRRQQQRYYRFASTPMLVTIVGPTISLSSTDLGKPINPQNPES